MVNTAIPYIKRVPLQDHDSAQVTLPSRYFAMRSSDIYFLNMRFLRFC